MSELDKKKMINTSLNHIVGMYKTVSAQNSNLRNLTTIIPFHILQPFLQ